MNKKHFLLVGYPLTHSLSPFIHQQFAKQFDIAIDYQAVEIANHKLKATMDHFVAIGGAGINITAPYKELVFQQLQNHYPRALQAKAVNTIVVKPDGSLWGDNTDGAGLIADFKRHNIPVTAQRILILGAGGAVRGILAALLELQPKNIIIVNRDLIRAANVVTDFKKMGDLIIDSYENLAAQQVDVVINATSNYELFASLNFKHCYCYDLNYKQNLSAIGVVNGQGMLVEQAAVAFELWHRKKPAVEPVLQAIRSAKH